MNRSESQATTTSLTPPPSDPGTASPVNTSRIISSDIPASNIHILSGSMIPKDYSHNRNTDQIIPFSHTNKGSNGDEDVTMRPAEDDDEGSDQGTVNGMMDGTEEDLLQIPIQRLEEATELADIGKMTVPAFADAEAHMEEYGWIGTYGCRSLHSCLTLCRASSTRNNPAYLAQTKFSRSPSSTISSTPASARRGQACWIEGLPLFREDGRGCSGGRDDIGRWVWVTSAKNLMASRDVPRLEMFIQNSGRAARALAWRRL